MAIILAIGTTAANSSDVVIEVGEPLTVSLEDAAGPKVLGGALVHILLKADSGEYFRVGQLSAERPAAIIDGAGTYRFSRVAGVSCGVFSG